MKENVGFFIFLITQAIIASTGPEAVCPSELVRASVTQDVILQCLIVPSVDTTNMTVEWSRVYFNYTVHLYEERKNSSEEQSNLINRTSLSYEGLTRGNLSLRLFSVHLSDTGTYKCSFRTENLQNSCYVNFTVAESKDNRREDQSSAGGESDRQTMLIVLCVTGIVLILITGLTIAIICRTMEEPQREVTQFLEVCVDGFVSVGQCLDRI